MARKSHNRKMKRGGSNPNLPYAAPVKFGGAAYTSGSSYGPYVNGSGDSQYDRVFSLSSPDANNQSNAIWGVQGQNLGLPGNVTPTAQNLSLIQSAGSRRRMRMRGMSRSRGRSMRRSRGRSMRRSRGRSMRRSRGRN
jgi:hypothetical protein